jgi:hypothetical protein
MSTTELRERVKAGLHGFADRLVALQAAERAAQVAGALYSLGPRFWLFAIGVAMAAKGAAMIHPAAGWLVAGLLIVWDCTKPPTNPRGGR